MNALPQVGETGSAVPLGDIVPSFIRSLSPYVGGKPIEEVAREFGLDPDRIIKLASNENPLGFPESARQAILKEMHDLTRYPDGNGFQLKSALSSRYGLPQDWITLGSGSNDILELVAQVFLQKDPGQTSSAIYSEYGFIIYELISQARGARLIRTPARAGYGHDLDAMAAAIAPDTRVVFIANPNNPTGTFETPDKIEAFLNKVPSRVIVLLDEAYNEYLEPELRYDSTEWVRRFPNLVVTHTFSKAFGLAGLRVGFSFAQPAVTDMLNRVRQPFNVTSPAMAAATAMLNDQDYLSRSYALNRAGLTQLNQVFDRLGLESVPSFGNFVLVKVGQDAGAGERVNLELLKRGIIVRPVAGYGLPEWLRISVGTAEENEMLAHALKEVLAA